jgi:hypothetical protein
MPFVQIHLNVEENMPTLKNKVQLGPETAFEKCLIAFGEGVGPLKIKDNVVVGLRWRFLHNIEKVFRNDPTMWDTQKHFILDCSRSIGSVAASKAQSAGSLSVNWKDHVRDAVKIVIAPYAPVPGVWCAPPDSPEPPEIQQ